MTPVFVARSNSIKLSKKLLSSNAITNSLKKTHAKTALSSFIREFHQLDNQKDNKKNTKGLRVAFVSGVFLVASYVSLSTHYLSDTGPSNGLRSFSTTNSTPESSKANKQNLFLLSDEEVCKRLRSLEESYFVNRGKGVVRYDISQLPSNNPIEDDRSESVVTVPKSEDEIADFYFWGIYDGHSGYYTSLKLREELINHVVNELGAVFTPDPENSSIRLTPNQESIDTAIKNGFLRLDQEIVEKALGNLLDDPTSKEKTLEALAASSGSCGLLTFYDSSSKLLKVAVTGDSRAVLGSLNEKNEWTAKSLSVDQTGDNPYEVQRIRSEHPNEPNVVRNGRVLGSLQPTRAFGDFRYKLKEINGKAIANLPDHLKLYFRAPPRNLLTPPYVTAEPVVSTTPINPTKNDFVVLGSDGLYELLSDEEIVGLVVKWMEKNKVSDKLIHSDNSKWTLFGSNDENRLPKVIDLTDDKIKEFQRPAFRSKKTDDQHEFLLEDSNCSTHLIRNALSLGGSKEYLSTLVSIPSPTSRKYRDDLTVTVIFFGEEGPMKDDGKIEINHPATRGGKVPADPRL